MSQSQHDILLYTAKICPFAHRSELALELSGVPYKTHQIDLHNKPSWYAEKVNKASKVPTLVLDSEKPNQFTLPESLVIVEFVSDLLDSTSKHPIHSKDPKVRADSRYLVERFSQLLMPHYIGAIFKGDSEAYLSLCNGLVEFNNLIVERNAKGTFIAGDELSFVDISIAPFIGRFRALSKAGLLSQHAEVPKPLHEFIDSDSKLERLSTWWKAVSATPQWQKTFDEEYVIQATIRRIEAIRNQLP
ncbi:hypothetical protein ACQY0O_003652 [Thecaphora frezii]